MHAITVLAVVAAFGLVFLSLLALCAERGFRPLAGVGRLYKPLHAIERFLLMLFVGVLVALAGTKDDDGDSTNSPPTRMENGQCKMENEALAYRARIIVHSPFSILHSNGVTISENETNLGYRVLAVREGDEIVPPQTDAVTNTAWLLRGGRNDAFRIGMDPEPTEEDWWLNPDPQWAFPWGDSWSYGLTVFARGEFQPTVHAEYFPKPFGETSASLSAESSEGALGDLVSRQIAFAQGKSDWVDWPLQRTILSAVDVFDQKWSWRVSDVNGSSSGSFNMVSTGPHRIYVILDNPVYPWRTSAGHISLVRTNVLELACTVAHGLSSEQDILSSLARYLFANMGYGYSGTSYLSTDLQFYLTTYLERLLTTANCYDQANALKSCAAAMGIRTETYEMEPFGYLNPMHIVGVEGMCNNPGAVGIEVLRPVNDTSRAWFRRHAFVIYGNDLVYDACLGPFCGVVLSDYLSQCIDRSTDAERDVGYYSTIPGVGGRSPVSYRVISTQ